MTTSKKPFKLLKHEAHFCELKDLVIFFKNVAGFLESKIIEISNFHKYPGIENYFRINIPVSVLWASRKPSVEETKQKIQKDKDSPSDIKSQSYSVEELVFYLKHENRMPSGILIIKC